MRDGPGCLVSIVMSVHNGDNYLSQAVDSILNQTFTNFEFIIIDDGSTDQTWSILNSYTDPRICLIQNEENIGLTKSLNKGLALAQGKYIARMDADDVSYLERLQKQVDGLEAVGADVIFCRSVIVNDANGNVSIWKEAGWPLIRWRSLFENGYGLHSAVMFRSQFIRDLGGYDESFPRAQDYDLWDRLASRGARFIFTTETLFRYRQSIQGISRQHLSEQEDYARRVSFRAMSRLLPDAKDVELQGLRWFFLNREPKVSDECVQAGLDRSFELVNAFFSSNKVENGKPVWEDVAMLLVSRLGDVELGRRWALIPILAKANYGSRSVRILVRTIRAIAKSNKM